MKRPVTWSVPAERDLLELIAFTADHDPEAAFRLGREVRRLAAGLGVHATGRPGRV